MKTLTSNDLAETKGSTAPIAYCFGDEVNIETTYLETGTLKMLTARSVQYTAAAIQVYHTSSVNDNILPTTLAGNDSLAASNSNPGAKISLPIASIAGIVTG